MSRAPSGKILKVVVNQKQKNGDIYVVERDTRYDPAKKYNVILKTRLLYKIPKGASDPVPTRPRKKPATCRSAEEAGTCTDACTGIEASCMRTGLEAILSHVGRVSGIDKAVQRAMDRGDALKAVSIARYIVATDGGSLPEIEEWQLRHELPYRDGISEDVYHRLFEDLGCNETARQKLFIALNEGSEANDGIFYDSTTVSTYSKNIDGSRIGFNKDKDGLPVIRLLTFYSYKRNKPVAYAIQPGNISDKASIPEAIGQINCLSIKKILLVTDTGFTCQKNLGEYVKNNIPFLTLVPSSWMWIREYIDKQLDNLEDINSLIQMHGEEDVDIKGVTVKDMHDFVWERKNNYKDKKKGEKETINKKIYIHIYKSKARNSATCEDFTIKIKKLQSLIENNEELTDAQINMRDEFFTVEKKNNKIIAKIDNEKYQYAVQRKGIFVTISTSVKDTKEALECYRKREWIENFFKMYKDDAGGKKPHVWKYETYKGRVMVQFIAMCYVSWLYNKIGELKEALGKENGDKRHDLSVNLDAENNLLKWLNKKSLHQILLYFDAYETVKVNRSNKRIKSWSTATTERDKLFLGKIGMELRS